MLNVKKEVSPIDPKLVREGSIYVIKWTLPCK